MTLPLRSQIPMPFSFNTPELFSQNSFLLTNRRPSIVSSNSSSTSSLSNWNGENMDYLCGSGSSSEASMSDGLSQMISLSNFDMGLEMAVPTTNNNNTGINQSVMPEYITGDMQFAPPPSSLYQQQQQLFDNVYQADLWNTYYPMDGGMAIASQVNSNAAHAYAQHTTHGCAHAPTLASSTASIPNWFLWNNGFRRRKGDHQNQVMNNYSLSFFFSPEISVTSSSFIFSYTHFASFLGFFFFGHYSVSYV